MDKRERGRQNERDKRGISDKRKAMLSKEQASTSVIPSKFKIIGFRNNSIILSGKRERKG